MFAFLLYLWLGTDAYPALQAQDASRTDYSPAQVLAVLRQLRADRWDMDATKLAACLKNSSDNRWTDLQAHFYCWLRADLRACFTGAVDGDIAESPDLKGDYEKAFQFCQNTRGRVYGVPFDKPVTLLSPEAIVVFQNLMYRRGLFPFAVQEQVLQSFYQGKVPLRRSETVEPKSPIPNALPQSPSKPSLPPSPLPSSPAGNQAAKADESKSKSANAFPKSCLVKVEHARARLHPDGASAVVGQADKGPIQVTGPLQSSPKIAAIKWYPVLLPENGKAVHGFMASFMLDCSSP